MNWNAFHAAKRYRMTLLTVSSIICALLSTEWKKSLHSGRKFNRVFAWSTQKNQRSQRLFRRRKKRPEWHTHTHTAVVGANSARSTAMSRNFGLRLPFFNFGQLLCGVGPGILMWKVFFTHQIAPRVSSDKSWPRFSFRQPTPNGGRGVHYTSGGQLKPDKRKRQGYPRYNRAGKHTKTK